MTLERILTRAVPGGPTQHRLRARLVAGQGIEGDRYFGVDDDPCVNVTLIEAEAIEAFFASLSLPPDLAATGRNLVTRGVSLNGWVGRRFTVGGVLMRGVEWAEPCMTLGTSLAAMPGVSLTPADVVRRFVHRGGLRAAVLSDGEIRVGDPVLEAARDAA
jgi:MOSC domain-containing protein YiiM